MQIDLHEFSRIVFFTGAGLSAESGIPTYRGKGGMWEKYNWEDYACQRAFDSDPEKVWEFHEARREFVAKCEPSRGHGIIAEIEKEKPDSLVITQNIDGLHARAGSQNIIELHGSLWRFRCEREGTTISSRETPLPSKFCACGEPLRPDIVWFEDALDGSAISQAMEALTRCDIIVSVGTSAVVYPAAQLPLIAMQRGITSVEINPQQTPLTELFTTHLQGKASDMLSQLWP